MDGAQDGRGAQGMRDVLMGRSVQKSTILYNIGMITISASEARQTLPEQLDRVEAGEQVTITRHGRPVAVLVRPDALRSPRTAQIWAEADALGERLEAARKRPLGELKGISTETAEEILEYIRAGRESR